MKKTVNPADDVAVYLTPGVQLVYILHTDTDSPTGPGHCVGPRVVVGRHCPLTGLRVPGLVTPCTKLAGDADQAGGGRHPRVQDHLGQGRAGNTRAAWRQPLPSLHRETVVLRGKALVIFFE